MNNNIISTLAFSNLTDHNDHILDWSDNNLRSKDKYPDKEHYEIIRKLKRSDIFEHKYTVEDLFKHIYKGHNSKAKRQPNPFMLFRAVLGKVASKSKVKIGDGTFQSKLAGFIWGGASQEEKKRFEDLATDFKDYHKKKFPNYEYKPKARSPTAGTIFDSKTPNDFVPSPNLPNFDVSYDEITKSSQNPFKAYMEENLEIPSQDEQSLLYSPSQLHTQNEIQELLYQPQQPLDFSFLNGNQFNDNSVLIPFISSNTLQYEEEQATLSQDFFEGYNNPKNQSIPYINNMSADTEKSNYFPEIAANCYTQNQNNQLYQVPQMSTYFDFNFLEPSSTFQPSSTFFQPSFNSLTDTLEKYSS